jgi:hypothetical protein
MVMFVALGLFLMACWRGMMLGMHDPSVLDIATAIPLVAMLGAALFVSSRYVTKPPPNEK